MSGFSFVYDGVAFSGSKLGASFKWDALQKSIIYDKNSDGPELARRQAEVRNRRATEPVADPDAELIQPDHGLAAPGRNAATADLAVGRSDHAAGPGDQRDRSAVAITADDGVGPAAQGDRVDASAQPGRENDGVGQSVNSADGVEGSQGRGEKLGRIEAIGVFEEVGQLAIRHDEGIKIDAWRVQAAALGAPAYQLTLKDRLRPLGQERIDPIGQGKKGQPAPSYSADQIQSLIPELRLSNQRGFDIYLTPIDPVHHHLVVHGLNTARLGALRAGGYTPALVQKSNESTLQAVMKISREAGRRDEQELADAVDVELNQQFGGKAASDVAPQTLPMAGFTHHQGTEKKSVLTVILDSLGQLCQKTWGRLVALRKETDQKMEEVATAQRVAKKKGLRAAELVQFEMNVQAYRRYAVEADEAQSQDQIDAVVAGGMLKEDYSFDQVVAVLRASPDLASRHVDTGAYVSAVVQRVQEALTAEKASAKVLRRGSQLNM